MKAIIHRGSHQIGGSCIELRHDGTSILLDLGLPLDADTAVASQLPPVDLTKIDAVLISHPHLDHYGLMHHLPPEVPVAMGPAARRILLAASDFMLRPIPDRQGPDLENGRPLDIGPFRITPYLVDHSAYDAYALLIEAGGKRLFYSGDLRDHGRKAALTGRLIDHPPRDIDALLLEGSSLGRLDTSARFPTEEELTETATQWIADTRGLVMVHMSAQNIDRVVSIYKAARRAGREMVIDLYTAAVLAATNNPRLPQSDWPALHLCTPQGQRVQILERKLFDVLKAHKRNRIFPEALAADPGRYVLLFRPLWMNDLTRAGALEEALLIYSQWKGYWDRGDYTGVEQWLARNGIRLRHLHTSGHAAPATLQRLAAAMAPRKLVPIHTFERSSYVQLFDDVCIHDDGQWWEV